MGGLYTLYMKVAAHGIVYMAFAHTASHAVNANNGSCHKAYLLSLFLLRLLVAAAGVGAMGAVSAAGVAPGFFVFHNGADDPHYDSHQHKNDQNG